MAMPDSARGGTTVAATVGADAPVRANPLEGQDMPDAKSPAGPGKATTERREAATEREELEEMSTPEDEEGNYTRGARTAERDAHVSGRNNQGAVPKGANTK
jgi:hypothetical protein